MNLDKSKLLAISKSFHKLSNLQHIDKQSMGNGGQPCMSNLTHTSCASTAYHYELTPANRHVNMMERSEDNSRLTIIISEVLIERISSITTDIVKLNVLLVK